MSTMNYVKATLVAAGLAFAGNLVFPGMGQAQLVVGGETIADAALLQAARAEGQFLYYTTNLEDNERAALEEFRKDTGIRSEVVRLNGSRMYERVMTEASGNKLAADLINLSDFVLMQNVVDKNILVRHRVQSWDAIPADLKHPDGLFYVQNRYAKILGYNTARVKKEDAPKSWKDLLDPRFRGAVGIQEANSGGIGWTTAMLQRQVVDPQYWQKLAANRPKLYTGLTQASEDVARGELFVAEMLPAQGRAMLDAGAPIALAFPSEGIPASAILTGVTATAKNPNAAKLYLNWILSKRGGTVIAEKFLDWPTHPEAPAPTLTKYNITFPPATLLWMGKKEDWVNLKDAWIKEWDQAYRSGK